MSFIPVTTLKFWLFNLYHLLRTMKGTYYDSTHILNIVIAEFQGTQSLGNPTQSFFLFYKQYLEKESTGTRNCEGVRPWPRGGGHAAVKFPNLCKLVLPTSFSFSAFFLPPGFMFLLGRDPVPGTSMPLESPEGLWHPASLKVSPVST